MKRANKIWVALGACWLGSCVSYGSGSVYDAHTFLTPPKIDGTIGEAEWAGAIKLDQFTVQATGNPLSEKTEAYVGVDIRGLYVMVRAYDTRPHDIVARTIQKGAEMSDDDFVCVIVDPMNRRDANGNSQFYTNTLGTQDDNIAGGRAAKKEWRGTWFSASTRLSDGYVVEIMIPWQLLSYPGGRKGDILFNVCRAISRTKEIGYASDMGRPFRQENHPVMRGVEFPKRSLSDQIDVLAYLSPEYDEDEDPSFAIRGGFDVRYKPTETLNALLSVSPDFKNIEGQVEGIGFTRTERFLSDTRPFFTEGAQYFNLTSGYGVGNMFYSNRIDDFDQGFKFFGDFNKRESLGFLVAREDGERTDSILKYGYRFGPRKNASAFATYRDAPGSRNSVMGAKMNYGSGNHDFGLEVMQSEDNGQAGSAGFAYFDTTMPNYLLSLAGIYVQPEFRARLGFVPFVDFQGGYLYQEYNREYRDGWLRNVHLENFTDDYNHFDGRNHLRSMGGTARIESRDDWAYGLSYNREVFEDEVSEKYTAGIGWNVSNRYRQLHLNYTWGDQNGSYTSFFSLNGTFRIAHGLDLGIEQSVFKLGGSREQSIVSLGWEMDSEQSVTGRYVKTDDDSNWYVAYRKSGGLGLEYFLIFGDPNAREFRNRAAFKVVWAR